MSGSSQHGANSTRRRRSSVVVDASSIGYHPAEPFKRGLELRVAGNLGLDLHQPRVLAVELHQFLVRALFDQPALVEDEDAVGIAQRAQPMGDRQRRAAASEDAERLLDRLFRFGVDAARGLVEDQHLAGRRAGPARWRRAAARRRRGRRRVRPARCRSPAACGG